ncbi:unnamed protein product [Clonostachys rosea]|uniref:Uncharacterized protein n=1 Tax=Bionectria ochroleuca TaxID=29856 RepID=A0ABY6TYQ6_BIOOC|nr:unnamed protein product [Clonostachys rosea]
MSSFTRRRGPSNTARTRCRIVITDELNPQDGGLCIIIARVGVAVVFESRRPQGKIISRKCRKDFCVVFDFCQPQCVDHLAFVFVLQSLQHALL